jgi:hypothetical protein
MPIRPVELRKIKVSGSVDMFKSKHGQDVKVTDENGKEIYAEGFDISISVDGDVTKAVLHEIVAVEFTGKPE